MVTLNRVTPNIIAQRAIVIELDGFPEQDGIKKFYFFIR